MSEVVDKLIKGIVVGLGYLVFVFWGLCAVIGLCAMVFEFCGNALIGAGLVLLPFLLTMVLLIVFSYLELI